MTTELTKAAQQALEALKETLLFCETFSNRWDGETGAHPFGMVERARAAVPILTRALTQRPAANPTAQELESAAKICDGSAAPELAAALRGQRPAAQTEREADGLPLIVAGAIFDFAGFMTTRAEVIEVGSTAEAGPVADLVKEWAELRGLDLTDAAVLSWQLHITRASLPAPQQATPEPVAWSYELAHRFHADGNFSDWRPHITRHEPKVPAGSIRNLRPLVYGDTRPAPGLPEDVQRNANRWQMLAELHADSLRPPNHRIKPAEFEAYRTAIADGFTTEYAIDAALAAAQAKGAGHA